MSGKSALVLGLVDDVYASVFTRCILMSDTVAYDASVVQLVKTTKHKNIFVTDEVTNGSIAEIMADQTDLWSKSNQRDTLLLFIDDSGDSANSKELNKELSKLFTKSRHVGTSIIVAIQSISGQLTRKHKGCTTEWIVFRNNMEDLKVLARVLSSAFKTEKEVYAYLIAVTEERFSFAYVNTRSSSAKNMYRYCDPVKGFMDYC
ncbi:hypothetical protein PhCBS80983_g06165 [Powellomyces hirtus]|uniref:Uncharacterized protein n=1 Tax=Powellomyces hirtus TaxID=109895 RepID=A0A507DQ87_9FUNG|nr:hypothetical protein PhCBS80983_g06165 [Powellomyces hirtus]